MSLIRVLPVLLLGTTLLAGCSSAAKPGALTEPTAAEDARCNAESLQALVGKSQTQALVDQARQQAGAKTARVLHPQDAVTLEYNPQRLNIHVDDSLVIRSVNCG
ncbi:I78 family peptidase inhibitor [Pseudomonas sp. QL9]|uniref:I78 family peptidase inhibitor n=1 Tax=Pseudomonas sp. QL9 TaxID=3242725 RepID=UPI00352B9965